jgi:hypothetical protein
MNSFHRHDVSVHQHPSSHAKPFIQKAKNSVQPLATVVPTKLSKPSSLLEDVSVTNNSTEGSVHTHSFSLHDKVVLKRGWIYKKGPHFYSSWSPKWAVLGQPYPSTNDPLLSCCAVLDLYEDRSHVESHIPPKHSLLLNANDRIIEVPHSRDRRRMAWMYHSVVLNKKVVCFYLATVTYLYWSLSC